LLVIFAFSILSGCMTAGSGVKKDSEMRYVAVEDMPEIPEKLRKNEAGIPVLSVYDNSVEEISEMDIETYVMGVVAGEMKNDWPVEALKAQAILARTFVLKFCEDKTSKYKGADISTDIEEAQAYSYENINDNVRKAINDTKGLVMSKDGEYPYAWFHAHSGGKTELPSVAIDFKGEDPEYLDAVDSGESDAAPESVRNWTVEFTKDEVKEAAKASGIDVESVETVEIGDRGKSGRAATILINGQSVSGPTFRLQIGADRLKSTLIEKISVEGDTVGFTGKGFGHGVGMSQWGAYAMAEAGKNAREIIEYYFPDVDIADLW